MPRSAFYMTLSQAARETGKSKSVIAKALKDGTLSYAERDKSGYKIDPAELFRVFPRTVENAPKTQEERPETAKRTVQETAENTPENGSANALERVRHVATLEAENRLLSERLKDKDEQIVELKEERNRWRDTAERVLLTYQPSATPPEKPDETETAERVGEGEALPETPSEKLPVMIYALLSIIVLLLCVVMYLFRYDIERGLNAWLHPEERSPVIVDQRSGNW